MPAQSFWLKVGRYNLNSLNVRIWLQLPKSKVNIKLVKELFS